MLFLAFNKSKTMFLHVLCYQFLQYSITKHSKTSEYIIAPEFVERQLSLSIKNKSEWFHVKHNFDSNCMSSYLDKKICTNTFSVD